MKKLFLILLLCPFLVFSQAEKDTIIAATNLSLLDKSLVYTDYSSQTCFTKGDYIQGINEKDILYISDIYKCKSTYREDEYFLKVHFADKVGYVDAKPDKILLFDHENVSVSEFYEKFQKLSDSQKNIMQSYSPKLAFHTSEDKKSELFSYLRTFEKYGIAIINANPTEGYSTTGAEFKILNVSKKTIKYITFTYYGQNPVRDKVGTNRTSRGIGPVESFAKGSWKFDMVWLTDIVEYLKMVSIQIQYMDGKIKTIPFTQSLWIDEDKLYELESLL